jgi:hypothetical protein
MVNGEMKRKYIDAGDAKPSGVIIYYNLEESTDDVTLTILDENGGEVISFGGDYVSKNKGLNRFVWDTRYPNALAIPGKPKPNVRPFGKPGQYQVQLSVNGQSQTESFNVFMNPNETFSQEDADARFELWIQVRDKYSEVSKAIIESQKIVKEVNEKAESKKQKKLAESITASAKDLEGSMTAVGTTLVQIANERSKLLAKIQGVSEMLISSEGPPSQGAIEAWGDYKAAIDLELGKWQKVVDNDVVEFNKSLN